MDFFSNNPIVLGIFDVVIGILQSIWQVFEYVWWIVIPLALAFYWWDLRVIAVKKAYAKGIKWVTLELRIPKENLRTPKSMEQVFAALHTIYPGELSWKDINLKGKSQPHISFEIVGQNGGVYFYIRTPDEYRNLIESALFAQYPQAEITQVDDYAELMPATLPNAAYDIWGTDLMLAKDDAYPIKTYEYFEEKEEEQRIDPLSPLLETFSKLKGDEFVWIQYLARPTGDATHDYKKKGQAIVDKMLGREVKEVKELGVLGHLFHFFKNFTLAVHQPPVWPEAAKKAESTPKTIASLSFSEKEALEGIERKISKLCFETGIRVIYIDKRETFAKSHIASIVGAFKQFGAEHLNAFKPNKETAIKAPKGFMAWLRPRWKAHQEYLTKNALYGAYTGRSFKKGPVFSVEELATLYHIPGSFVGAPSMRRIEAKKGEPPENLPIE